jgi:tetratricopeptide (TPR) repeat protein
MPKIRRKSHRPTRQEPGAVSGGSGYRHGIRQADDVMSKEGVEIRPDNWQQIALEWFTPSELEQSALRGYITAYEGQLGVAWARELVRMEVFLHAQDHAQIVEHYDRAFRAYPRCALVEMWVAGHLMRHSSDFWRARQMYQYAAAELPAFAKPHYELGFMNYLLGDFPGALDEFDQAASLWTGDDVELGARIFYNRGMVGYAAGGDKTAALADLEKALKLKPDYVQAKEALRAMRGGIARWIPW